MSRGGTSKNRDAPERRCISTGEVQPTAALVRFVIGPDAQVVPDIARKLPGRGIWVRADRAALALAAKKKLFARAARMPVEVAPDLPSQVEALLAKRVVDLISLARKAGRAISGYEKVKGWLLTEEARILIQAHDGSTRGKSKLSSPEGKGTFIGILSAQELGLAFGREHVIHAALGSGRLTTRIVEEAARLKGVRELNGGTPTRKDDKT